MKEILSDIFENPRELFKNPTFYYILIPVLSGLWPIWVGLISLPGAAQNWVVEEKQRVNAEKIITEILTLDSERLQLAGTHSKSGKFNYATAVYQVAKICGIRDDNCELSSGVPTKVGDQDVQTGKVTLEKVDIEKFAEFLSMMQLRWPNLQCTQLKLTKQKGLPDLWKGNLTFKYYY